jgi:hypothetical protein
VLESSNKIIQISKYQDLSETLKGIITKHGMDIADDYSNLHSIDMIKKGIGQTGNTSFMRSELVRFIRETGFPFLFIMDYKIDTGVGKQLDPDGMKLLRTLLISCIILARGAGFEKLRGNFLLLAEKNDLARARQIESDPLRILKILSTSDKIVNSFINELKSNSYHFNQLFYIRAMSTESSVNDIHVVMDTMIKAIYARKHLKRLKETKASINTGDYEAAKVLYRLDDKKVYIDGEIKTVKSGSMNQLESNQFYVMGHWVNKTLIETADKVIIAVRKGLGTEKVFAGDDAIIINLTDKCIVDSTLTPSLIQILTKDLGSFSNITINITESNNAVLSQAKGYNLLKKSLHLIREHQ